MSTKQNDRTTVSQRNPLLSQPDEVQTAQNAFAVAIKRWAKEPTKENETAMRQAESHLLEVQELYRQGRQIKLVVKQEELQKLTGRRS